jgi:dolichol-phosphate mannosyltransferase
MPGRDHAEIATQGHVTKRRYEIIPRCTVVMPAYNEEGAISRAIADIRTHVLALLPDAEIIVVDDGSKDKTGGILDALAREEPRLRVLHKPNGGHGSAVIAGADIARGEWLFFIDSDQQIPLESFTALWRAVEQGAGAAFGVRRRRNDPRLRLWLTGIIRHSLYLLFGVRLYDANVPYKLVPRTLLRDARTLIPDATLAPSLFLAVFLARRGVRIAEIEVAHRERQTGEVSMKRWKLFRFCLRAFSQLFRFWRRLAA